MCTVVEYFFNPEQSQARYPLPPDIVLPVLPFSFKYCLLSRSTWLQGLYSRGEQKCQLVWKLSKSMYMCFHFLLTFPCWFLWVDVLSCSQGRTGGSLLVLPAKPHFYGKGTPAYKMSYCLLWDEFSLISLGKIYTATALLYAASAVDVFSAPTPRTLFGPECFSREIINCILCCENNWLCKAEEKIRNTLLLHVNCGNATCFSFSHPQKQNRRSSFWYMSAQFNQNRNYP